MGQDDLSREAVLRETLDALGLPPAGLRHWLERSRRFCERHGGARRYAEWMALYDQALEAMDAR